MTSTEGHLAELVDRETRDGEERGAGHYEGSDWWQLTPQEAEVFGLRLKDMPRLVTVFDVFEGLKGRSHNDFYHSPLCRAVRRDLKVKGDNRYSVADWMAFAARFGISNRVAFAFFAKHESYELRAGVMIFGDGS